MPHDARKTLVTLRDESSMVPVGEDGGAITSRGYRNKSNSMPTSELLPRGHRELTPRAGVILGAVMLARMQADPRLAERNSQPETAFD